MSLMGRNINPNRSQNLKNVGVKKQNTDRDFVINGNLQPFNYQMVSNFQDRSVKFSNTRLNATGSGGEEMSEPEEKSKESKKTKKGDVFKNPESEPESEIEDD